MARSGCADCVLDRLVRIVPAARYDLWCVLRGNDWSFCVFSLNNINIEHKM